MSSLVGAAARSTALALAAGCALATLAACGSSGGGASGVSSSAPRVLDTAGAVAFSLGGQNVVVQLPENASAREQAAAIEAALADLGLGPLEVVAGAEGFEIFDPTGALPFGFAQPPAGGLSDDTTDISALVRVRIGDTPVQGALRRAGPVTADGTFRDTLLPEEPDPTRPELLFQESDSLYTMVEPGNRFDADEWSSSRLNHRIERVSPVDGSATRFFWYREPNPDPNQYPIHDSTKDWGCQPTGPQPSTCPGGVDENGVPRDGVLHYYSERRQVLEDGRLVYRTVQVPVLNPGPAFYDHDQYVALWRTIHHNFNSRNAANARYVGSTGILCIGSSAPDCTGGTQWEAAVDPGTTQYVSKDPLSGEVSNVVHFDYRQGDYWRIFGGLEDDEYQYIQFGSWAEDTNGGGNPQTHAATRPFRAFIGPVTGASRSTRLQVEAYRTAHSNFGFWEGSYTGYVDHRGRGVSHVVGRATIAAIWDSELGTVGTQIVLFTPNDDESSYDPDAFGGVQTGYAGKRAIDGEPVFETVEINAEFTPKGGFTTPSTNSGASVVIRCSAARAANCLYPVVGASTDLIKSRQAELARVLGGFYGEDALEAGGRYYFQVNQDGHNERDNLPEAIATGVFGGISE